LIAANAINWNGALSSDGANALMVPGTAAAGRAEAS